MFVRLRMCGPCVVANIIPKGWTYSYSWVGSTCMWLSGWRAGGEWGAGAVGERGQGQESERNDEKNFEAIFLMGKEWNTRELKWSGSKEWSHFCRRRFISLIEKHLNCKGNTNLSAEASWNSPPYIVILSISCRMYKGIASLLTAYFDICLPQILSTPSPRDFNHRRPGWWRAQGGWGTSGIKYHPVY